MSEADRAPVIIGHEGSVTRRSFLGVLLGFGTVVMGTALSVPLIRFALHPLLTKTTEIGWSDVGKIEEFASLNAPAKRLIKVEQRDACLRVVARDRHHGAKISGPAPRSMDDLDSKVENGMLKVRYQYFRQLIPTKEALS